MKNKKFQKRKEDFVCEICGIKVRGTGYTNHCPSCLWSKHVDINPGDRQANCGGLMEPLGVIQKKGQWKIIHRCQKCGIRKANKTSPHDNFEKIIKLSQKPLKI
ncbi:MAG: RNHCP domain-containing protein [Microgenomates group bacterium]